MNKKILQTKDLWFLLGLIFAFQAIGALIGVSTSGQIDGWYQSLHKSPLTPPDYIFGVVWSILYVFLAVIFWRILRWPKDHKRSTVLKLFCAHIVLNWAWNPMFFLLHAIIASFVLIVIIFLTALYLQNSFFKQDRLSFALMVPYATWLIFAGYLSFYILLYN